MRWLPGHKKSNGGFRKWACEVCGREIRGSACTIHLAVIAHKRAEFRAGKRSRGYWLHEKPGDGLNVAKRLHADTVSDDGRK